MEARRQEDVTVRGKTKVGLKRIRTELSLILFCLILIIFLPREAQIGVMSLFITKTLFVVLGILVAHSTRKFLFPYIDLQKAIADRQWGTIAFLTVWYAVIVYAFATGG